VRLLEDHPDPPPNLDRIDVASVQVLAVVEDGALHLRPRDQVVHPVEAADERALPAPRRADEGGHGVLVHVEGHVLEGGLAAVRDPAPGDGEDLLPAPDLGTLEAASNL